MLWSAIPLWALDYFCFIFCGENLQNVEFRPRWKTWAEGSVRLLLTKNPACSCNCPWWVHGISFELFPRPWQTVGPISGPSRIADSSLTFLKEVGPLPELRRQWFACTGMSDEQTCPGSEPPMSARGVNPRVPFGLTSHLRPVKHEWL